MKLISSVPPILCPMLLKHFSPKQILAYLAKIHHFQTFKSVSMKIHFIAIGGAAMHNLAIALKKKGHTISGSDDEIFDPSRSRLATHGILPDKWGWHPEKINKSLDAVILGMHARKENPELKRAQELGIKIYSYPEFLFEQAKNKKRLVVAGSHGKTSITAMILHVLKRAGVACDYMVGAQLEGFDTMVGFSDDAEFAVFEGDEYLSSPIDRRPKFMWYHPHAAVITGIAWDHANVFPTEDDYIRQFKDFILQIPQGGKLAWYRGDEKLKEIAGLNPNIHSEAYDSLPYRMESGHCFVDTGTGEIPCQLFGAHNMQNMQAARYLCNEAGVSDAVFFDAIQDFKGAAKRLQLLTESDDRAVFLDFAHAPSKVKATTEAMKTPYPGRKLVACLELHTFSSLNAGFLPQYRGSLAAADTAFVYFNPDVVAHKKLPALEKSDIKAAFGTDIEVFTDTGALLAKIKTESVHNSNLLIMTSGNFDGVDIPAFAKEITNEE